MDNGVVASLAPPWLSTLPRDGRGFLIPAEAPWVDGEPRLSLVDNNRKVALAFVRACAVCGYELAHGDAVYRAFSHTDAESIRTVERELAHDVSGPGHRSCMIFSAFACPYLREPTSRLGKASIINPGARRGETASVMGFGTFGLLVYRKPHMFLGQDAPQPAFGYEEFVDDIAYTDGEEMLEIFQDAVRADRPRIKMGSRKRAFWGGRDKDVHALGRALQYGGERLAGARPTMSVDLLGTPYALFDMPV